MASESNRVPSETKSFLRSVLISSKGIKESRLERDYRELSGEKLDWKKLGFKSLNEFLRAIPDVCLIEYSTRDMENRVFAVQMEGIYMSTHAKKNTKNAPKAEPALQNVLSQSISTAATAEPVVPSASDGGRSVQLKGDSLWITVNKKTEDEIEILPNKDGLYHVYVANVPPNCIEFKYTVQDRGLNQDFKVQVPFEKICQRIGFIRYGLKKEACKALKDGKRSPPVIQGYALEVGQAKSKNASIESSVNIMLKSEPVHGLEMSPPLTTSSTQMTSGSQPTSKPALSQPRSSPALEHPSESKPSCQHYIVQHKLQEKPFSTGEGDVGCVSSDGPLFEISGHNRTVSKAEQLPNTCQNVSQNEDFNYHPCGGSPTYTTKEVKSEAMKKAEITFEQKPVKNPSGSPGEDPFSKLYRIYTEAIAECSGKDYQTWLNSLPTTFSLKVIDIADPCAFWVHVFDQTLTHKDYDDLILKLQKFNMATGTRPVGKGELCIGRFSGDGMLYRCYCFDVAPDGRRFHVMYVDYGNTEWLARENIARLSGTFFQLRPQGVLMKLSGVTFISNQNTKLDESVLLSAKLLLMNCKTLEVCKAPGIPSKPLILDVEILDAQREYIFTELSSFAGYEVRRAPSSLEPLLSLSMPPVIPGNWQPLKPGLSDEKKTMCYIWITHMTSPTSFYFQMTNYPAREAINDIREALLKCDIQDKINIENIGENDLVCYHRNSRERSRVSLRSLSRPLPPGQVDVLHVDSGKEAVVPCTSFIALSTEASAIKYQARPASLYNVPREAVYPAVLSFFTQKINEVLLASIHSENSDGSVFVELYDRQGESVNKKMLEIAGGYRARPALRQPGLVTSTDNQAATLWNQARPPQNQATPAQHKAKPAHSSVTAVRTSAQYQPKPAENQALQTPAQAKPVLNRVVPAQDFAAPEQGQVHATPAQNRARITPEQNRAQLRPAQNRAQATPTQNAAEVSPAQNLTQPSPVQNRDQSTSSHNLAQVKPERKKARPTPAQNRAQPTPAQNRDQPTPAQNRPHTTSAKNLAEVAPERNQVQPKPAQNRAQPTPAQIRAQHTPAQNLIQATPAQNQGLPATNSNKPADKQAKQTHNQTKRLPDLLSVNTNISFVNMSMMSSNMTSADMTTDDEDPWTSPISMGVRGSMDDAERKGRLPRRQLDSSSRDRKVAPSLLSKVKDVRTQARPHVTSNPGPFVLRSSSPASPSFAVPTHSNVEPKSRVSSDVRKPPDFTAHTAVSASAGSTVSRAKTQDYKETKHQFDEKPAKEGAAPKDLKPVRSEKSGNKNFLIPTPPSNFVREGVLPGMVGDKGDFSLEEMDRQDLVRLIKDQEKVLARPKAEQREHLNMMRTKQKLEIQVRIKELENAILKFENELQSLTADNERLQNTLGPGN